jgi:eukaryotic-like serine/threonine-protein kinase
VQGPPTTGFAPGQVLAGKYRVERVLGAGGMGVVVAATHLELDERVAVKFLNAQGLRNQEVLARFAQEARAASKIKGEHVARTLDVGHLENGVPYLVMEYLDGADLATRLSTQGPLHIDQAVDYVLQACEALAEAHILGIVHRDLKPANLFVTRRPDGTESVKVLDFGISKVTKATGSMPVVNAAMTALSAVMGSPLYLSPEQTVSARSADARSDIWALGVTLYEILTGWAPFQAGSLPDLYHQIQTQPAPALRNLRPDAPERLQQTVLRCLEKRPEDRFQSISELAMALAEFAPLHARLSVDRILRLTQVSGGASSGIGLTGPVSEYGYGPGSMVGSTAGTWAQSQGQTQQSVRPGRAGLWIAVAASVLVLGGVAAGVAVRLSSAASPGAASAPIASAPFEPTRIELTAEVDRQGAPAVSPVSASARTPATRTAPTATPGRPAPPSTAAAPTPAAPRAPDPNSLFRDRH